MVVCLSLPSLLNVCSCRVAYLMWTRRDVTGINFEELEDIVLADVQNLPLPKEVKSHVLNHVKPVGKHLFSFVNLWLQKTQLESDQKWLTRDILFDCLVLSGDGLINHRETAKKILSRGMLHNEIAFRLACINYLEEEILKLWPFVLQYFLNKIEKKSETDFQILTEPIEVLVWIGYCMSKESAINKPYSVGPIEETYKLALDDAMFCGNVACLDYFKFCQKKKIEYDHVSMIEKLFSFTEKDLQLSCFISQFIPLSSEEKAGLFQKFPRMVFLFLQWPLSLTFAENIEKLWNLIPETDKSLVFLKIFMILFPRSLTHPRVRFYFISKGFDPQKIIGIYNLEHLESIWIALWKISVDFHKISFLHNSFFSRFGFYGEFDVNFGSSELKEKLLPLFLSHGQVVLDLFKGTNIKESLRNIISKYMPDDLEYLDRNVFHMVQRNRNP